MAESFLDGKVELHCGDCLAVLDTLPENAIDGAVIDPPYHLASIVKRYSKGDARTENSIKALGTQGVSPYMRGASGFMGKQWDGGDIAFQPETWAKVLRVLKPGAHLLAFAAPKNVGLLQVAIEAAGFETRDCILDLIDLDPLLAQFVGSLNDAQRGALFRLIDEGAFWLDGCEQPSAGGLLAWLFGSGFPKNHAVALEFERALCVRAEVKGRAVWAYKSDGEEMARVPPFRDPRAQEWAGYGTALKPAFEPIVLARKPLDAGCTVAANCLKWGVGALNIDACRVEHVTVNGGNLADNPHLRASINGGNGGQIFPTESERRVVTPNAQGRWPADVLHDGSPAVVDAFPAEEFGSAARFFYTAKADADDRLGSKHPTVKPLDLIEYLIRLVTRPGQTVLDCFAGTGTTGEAAFRQGRRAVLIEREPEYQADIRRRMSLALGGPEERARASIKAGGKAEGVETLPLFWRAS